MGPSACYELCSETWKCHALSILGLWNQYQEVYLFALHIFTECCLEYIFFLLCSCTFVIFCSESVHNQLKERCLTEFFFFVSRYVQTITQWRVGCSFAGKRHKETPIVIEGCSGSVVNSRIFALFYLFLLLVGGWNMSSQINHCCYAAIASIVSISCLNF